MRGQIFCLRKALVLWVILFISGISLNASTEDHRITEIDFGDIDFEDNDIVPLGEYRFDKFLCFDSSGALAGQAELFGFSDTITIQGDDFSELTRVGGCSLRARGRIEFRSNKSYTLNAAFSVPNETCSATAYMIVTVDRKTEVVPLNLNFKDGQSTEISGSYAVNSLTGAVKVTELFPSVSVGSLTCAARYVPE